MPTVYNLLHPIKALRKWNSVRSILRSYDLSLLKNNVELLQWRSSDRCIILGTSPSVSQINLSVLKNENCLCLNLFGLHQDVKILEKSLHIYSGLAAHSHIKVQSGINLYSTLHDRIHPDSPFVTNIGDANIIRKHELLAGRKVYYLALVPRMLRSNHFDIDAVKPISSSFSVSQIALQLALYMGYKKIVLAGIDHDAWFLYYNRQNPHFYEPNDCPLERNLPSFWERPVDWHHQFQVYNSLWNGYKTINSYATKKGRVIVNASASGILDVFTRVTMEAALKDYFT